MSERRKQNYIRALCLCGCGQRVKHHYNKYASVACVPRSIRADACKKGRRTFAYRRRAVLFQASVDRLTSREGRRVSKEDLLTVLMDVYRVGYTNGYHASDWKQRNRKVAA